MLGRGKGGLEAYRRREAGCQGFHSPNPPGAGQTRRVAAGGDGHHHFLSRNQQIKPQLITFECSPRSGSGQYRVERPKWQSCQMLIAAMPASYHRPTSTTTRQVIGNTEVLRSECYRQRASWRKIRTLDWRLKVVGARCSKMVASSPGWTGSSSGLTCWSH